MKRRKEKGNNLKKKQEGKNKQFKKETKKRRKIIPKDAWFSGF